MRFIHKIIRVLLLVLGLIFLLNGIIICLYSNINIGNIITIIFGVLMLLCGFNYNYLLGLDGMRYRILRICIGLFIVAMLSVQVFITLYGSINTAKYDEDAVIILGCGIHGEKVSAALMYRLDAGIEYHKKNSNAVIVVSGGQGPQEDITEAEAMERYLLARGIDRSQIIKEEQATSTYENFLYSKEILDRYLNTQSYKVTYITNDFHSYRAGQIAKQIGLDATRYTAPIGLILIIPANMREFLAIVKYWIFAR